MTAHRYIVISCQGRAHDRPCLATYPRHDDRTHASFMGGGLFMGTVAEARAAARRHGWRHIRNEGIDLCPQCFTKRLDHNRENRRLLAMLRAEEGRR